MLKRILAFHAKRCRFARKQQRRNLRFKSKVLDHLMENIIFSELKVQGFDVDVGVVESFEKNKAGNGIRKQLEIDFMANRGRERYYVQSALSIDDPDKAAQEKRPFSKLDDSFRKIIIVKGKMPPRIDEKGYVIVGLVDFLLNPSAILV